MPYNFKKDFEDPLESMIEMQGLNSPKKYKPFREQFIECGENGNRIKVDTLPMKAVWGHDVGEILVCVKNKCICHSGVCKEERI